MKKKLSLTNFPLTKSLENFNLQNKPRLKLTYDDAFECLDNMVDKFLEIGQKNFKKRTHQEIVLIMQYLNSTELMKKLKGEIEATTQTSYEHLMFMCASNLKFRQVKKDEIIFDIDGVGDYFYILFYGKLSVLKPKELPLQKWNLVEYYEYLNFLLEKNQVYLIEKTLEANFNQFPIKEIQKFEMFKKYILKVKLLRVIRMKSFDELIELFFSKNFYNYSPVNYTNYLEELGINFEHAKMLYEADKIKTNKSSKVSLFYTPETSTSSIHTWVVYLESKTEVSFEEIFKFEKIEESMRYTRQKQEFIIYEYENVISINEGQYFGDYALDNSDQKRTARVQAEEDSFIGYMNHEIYNQYIKNEKAKLRAKEFAFINEYFFFNQLKLGRKFISEYYLLNFNKGMTLFEAGKKFENLYLISEGEVKINFSGNIKDLFELMQKIVKNFDKIINSTEKLNESINIKKYLDISYYLKKIAREERDLRNLKNKSPDYIKYLNAKRNYNISIMSSKEICGMEEFFLCGDKYFHSGEVSSKTAKIYQIGADKIRSLIATDNRGVYSIFKHAIGRVVSVIKRIDHIKDNLLEKFVERGEMKEFDLRDNNIREDSSRPGSGERRNTKIKRQTIITGDIKLRDSNSLHTFNGTTSLDTSSYLNKYFPQNGLNMGNINSNLLKLNPNEFKEKEKDVRPISKKKHERNKTHHHNYAIHISNSNDNKNWTNSDLQQLHRKKSNDSLSNFTRTRQSNSTLINKGSLEINEIKNINLKNPQENFEKRLNFNEDKKINSTRKQYLDNRNPLSSLSNFKSLFLSANVSKENFSFLNSGSVSQYDFYKNELPNVNPKLKFHSKNNSNLPIAFLNFQERKNSNLFENKNERNSFYSASPIPVRKNDIKTDEIKNMKKTFQNTFMIKFKKIKLAKIKKEHTNFKNLFNNPGDSLHNETFNKGNKFLNFNSTTREKVVDILLDEDHHSNNQENQMRYTVRTVKEFYNKKKKIGVGNILNHNIK